MSNIIAATAVVILVPPAAPMTNSTSLLAPTLKIFGINYFESKNVFSKKISFYHTTMVGVIELIGLLQGLIKLFGDGGKSNPLVIFGALKSSISSLKIIPVELDRNLAPILFKENKL